MAKANVDPTELRRFASDLNRFNTDLESLVGGLNARLQALEKTWQDQEQKRFTQEFQQTIKFLKRFMEVSTQHVSFLNKKAKFVEEYLNQH